MIRIEISLATHRFRDLFEVVGHRFVFVGRQVSDFLGLDSEDVAERREPELPRVFRVFTLAARAGGRASPSDGSTTSKSSMLNEERSSKARLGSVRRIAIQTI